MEKRIFKPLDVLSLEQIQEILEEGTDEELILLPLSVGEYHQDWKKAQDIYVQLMGNKSPKIRANAALGLSYIARTKGALEKHVVKPLLIRELRENIEYQWRIIDAIEDINLFLNWHIAEKAIAKLNRQ